jgi:ABC-type Fe3+-hydroxamate transport system substrate-binding protein
MEAHMRLASYRKSLFLALAATALASAPALAGGLNDRVYADSFGNLIIHSPAGYKRIVVGEGYLADQLAQSTAADDPDVVYLDETDIIFDARECYRPPWLLKGRSYMYGFDEGEIPFQGGPCR